MKKRLSLIVLILFSVSLVGTLGAATATPPPPSTSSSLPVASQNDGIAAAKALTQITGVAISPILGVGVMGAYNFFTCPKGKEDSLPWYAQVKFWLPALLLVAAVAAKDTWGAAWPIGWKKPFDVAETVENKITALVVAGAVVPSIAAIFHSAVTSSAAADPHMAHASFLGMSFMPLLNILTIPLAIVAFVLVWLVGHVINVLILVSPWGQVDAALKVIRTSILGALAALQFINPMLGAIISLGIIILAYCLAGWSFRLMVFGSVYAWDFFTFRRKRFTPEPKRNWMFTARKIEKTPIRTYGKLERTEAGELSFEYRPWLVMAPRTIKLPPGKYAIGRGLFYPEIMTIEGDKTRSVLVLPPRYKKHEETIGEIYGIRDIQDVGLLKGLKAIWRWVTGQTAQPAAVAVGT